MKNYFLLMALFLISCQNSEQENSNFTTTISGLYKVIDIKSNSEVDMNNDGLKTNNMLDEICYYNLNGKKSLMVNFKNNFIAEVRPLYYQNNNAKLIDFRFPHQYLFPDKNANGEYTLMDNVKSLLGYQYELNENKIILNSYNDDFNNQVGEIISCVKTQDNRIFLSINKKVFDFKDQAWKIIPLEITYEKFE